jgi:arginyl-tRNA synthetase
MQVSQQVRQAVHQILVAAYPQIPSLADLPVQDTRPEFEGDFTVVLFSAAKTMKKPLDQIGEELGRLLVEKSHSLFASHQVIKGFLNLSVNDGVWTRFLDSQFADPNYGRQAPAESRVMVEYSSPNTNKPLHLGHLRNNFLGWSLSEIYKACGHTTVKTCIANDRGIHICKSMVAWQRYAGGATPTSTGMKGDHFVGDYYVRFGLELQKETAELVERGIPPDDAEKQSSLMKAAHQMLLDWEAGDPEVRALWKKMNEWVYAGFAETYRRIGTDFDRVYYESETYLLGKDLVELGLERSVFFQKEDGSVWIDLSAEGLDQKIVRRKDGTAVYMTQDIGLVVKKFEDYHCRQSVYVVGDEQNYHFHVLQLICLKLGLPAAEGIHHLSYGMVELPSGRMKTREGNVVDADDILDEMLREAERKTSEQGKTAGFSEAELKDLYEIIGIGGLKFFLLRVDPKKRMLFNPEESVDLHGFTATFIQYAHARIKSILRSDQTSETGKSSEKPADRPEELVPLLPAEKQLIVQLERYPESLRQALEDMDPSVVANYAYALAKNFNGFYSDHSVLQAESAAKKQLRLKLCRFTANTLASALGLLGIRAPERM